MCPYEGVWLILFNVYAGYVFILSFGTVWGGTSPCWQQPLVSINDPALKRLTFDHVILGPSQSLPDGGFALTLHCTVMYAEQSKTSLTYNVRTSEVQCLLLFRPMRHHLTVQCRHHQGQHTARSQTIQSQPQIQKTSIISLSVGGDRALISVVVPSSFSPLLLPVLSSYTSLRLGHFRVRTFRIFVRHTGRCRGIGVHFGIRVGLWAST